MNVENYLLIVHDLMDQFIFYLPESEARQLYLDGHLDYSPNDKKLHANDSIYPFRSNNFIRGEKSIAKRKIFGTPVRFVDTYDEPK